MFKLFPLRKAISRAPWFPFGTGTRRLNGRERFPGIAFCVGSLLNSRSDEGSFAWRDLGGDRHGVEATDGPEWFFRPTRKSEREHTLCHHVFRGDTPRKSNEACFQGGKMIAGVILEPMIPASAPGGKPPSGVSMQLASETFDAGRIRCAVKNLKAQFEDSDQFRRNSRFPSRYADSATGEETAE